MTVLLNLLLLFSFRLLFLAIFASESEPLDTPTLLKSLYIGAKFDLRFAILIALPVAVASWIPGIHPARSALGRWIWLVYLTAVALATVFVLVVDMGHYAYLQSRVNATLLQFLETPAISAQRPSAHSICRVARAIDEDRPSKAAARTVAGSAASTTTAPTPAPASATPRVKPTMPPPAISTSVSNGAAVSSGAAVCAAFGFACLAMSRSIAARTIAPRTIAPHGTHVQRRSRNPPPRDACAYLLGKHVRAPKI